MRRILVIRLGALGDIALSFPAFAAIRAHHVGDPITLLTTAPFAPFLAKAPWFDDVRIDSKPSWLDLPGVLALRRQLRGFDYVYDLQTSGRSSRYFALAGRPPWSGIARGASHRHTNPRRIHLHSHERQRDQLLVAGISEFPAPALAWLGEAGPGVKTPFALLIPGTSMAHGGAKRWPIGHFGELARVLAARGLTPVVVGAGSDAALGAAILAACPQALDFTGKTSLVELAGLARRAAMAIGGDTGPIHLAAAMGCKVVALFSGVSDPALAAPRGQVVLLRETRLSDLTVARVAAALPAP